MTPNLRHLILRLADLRRSACYPLSTSACCRTSWDVLTEQPQYCYGFYTWACCSHVSSLAHHRPVMLQAMPVCQSRGPKACCPCMAGCFCIWQSFACISEAPQVLRRACADGAGNMPPCKPSWEPQIIASRNPHLPSTQGLQSHELLLWQKDWQQTQSPCEATRGALSSDADCAGAFQTACEHCTACRRWPSAAPTSEPAVARTCAQPCSCPAASSTCAWTTCYHLMLLCRQAARSS